MHAYVVEPLYVKCGQEVIAADFYHPKTSQKPAVILMAHGLAGLRQFKLMHYARRFAQAGYAVVVFDYRYWGGSTGRPRELVSIEAQLEDWHSMIEHVAQRKSIDATKIILWGTALSGGYVLDLAARQHQHVQAVMTQVPFIDGAESAKQYPLYYLPKALKISSQDYMGAKMGMEPKYLPVVDEKQLCFMPTADSYQGYLSIVNPDVYWSGTIPARLFFHLMRYRPILQLHQIRVPVLFIAAKQDSWIPIESSRAAATNIAPNVQYHEWDLAHFDIYHGENFEKAVQTQLDFLHQYIGVN